MFQEMMISQGGGGGKSKSDTFTLTNEAAKKHIDVGFQPKYLCVYFIPNTSQDKSVLCVYDESLMGANTKYWRALNNGNTSTCTMLTLPNNNNPLESVDSTGFYVESNAAWMDGTWYYFAIG